MSGIPNKTKSNISKGVVLQTALLSAFILASTLTICVLAVIPRFVHVSVNVSTLEHLFLFLASDASPEPAEFLQYVTGAFLFPILVLGLAPVLQKVLSWLAKRINMILIRNILAGFIIVSTVFLAWYDNLVSNQVYLKPNIFFTHPLTFSALAGITFALIIYSSDDKVADWLRRSRLGRLLINIPMYGLAMLAGLINIFTSGAVTLEPVYSNHFNAVFYAMSQVHAGKTILVNLVHQYGLYPHFLNLLFAATNLSVIKFTVVMAILIAIAMACLAMFLRREISNSLIALGGFVSIVYYGYFFLKPSYGFDPFFQYVPVRFIGPAVFIFLASLYYRNRATLLYVGISVFASFAIFWNLDTGAIVFISWLLSLAYIEFLERPLKEAIRKLALHVMAVITIFICCGGIFLTLMFLRSGELLNLGMAFSYQRYFSQYGFFLSPMPSIGPWNLVILVYALGLTYAIMTLLRRKGTPRDITVFMLSVIGVGIFSYYQGRSVDGNLTVVWYPAILLITLAADYSLTAFRRSQWRTYPNLVVLIPSVAIFTSAIFGLVAAGYSSYPAIYGRITAPGNPVTIEGVAFIAGNCHQGEPVLILSANAGMYYAESGTVNPLSGPGFGELFLTRDYDAIRLAIDKQKVKKIFVDTAFMGEKLFVNPTFMGNPDLITALISNYNARGASPSGNIIMYERAKRFKLGKPKAWLLPEITATKVHLQYLPDKGILTDGKLTNFKGIGLLTPGFNETRTYEILIRPHSGQNGNAIVIDNTSSAIGHRGFYIQCSDPGKETYQLVFGDGKSWRRKDGLRFSSNKWHYLALVIDFEKVSLYDNGAIVAEIRMKEAMSLKENVMYIGYRPLNGNPFKGDIKEFRISDSVLTAAEIRQISESLNLQ
jgi:hypothetical protein